VNKLQDKIDIAKKLQKLLISFDYAEFIKCDDGEGYCVEVGSTIINLNNDGEFESASIGL
jgi:hypothetical protein